ncbi:Tetratricopeptide TPR_2 repeat-containing protein [Actinobacteria bacterium OK074]|nr:Tetratricopeptide TPR_2 repeat-containing protein [Actinobacteria bacterium OK074]
MQELIGRRKRAGFVGRRAEIDRFRGNFELPPEDERHSFVFHIHGPAGVGKSSLVRELEAVAAGRSALMATTDDAVHSVPEAMAAISSQLARQGVELKALDKLLTTYRQRRHEAETASAMPDVTGAGSPSAGSMMAAQAGLGALGLLPLPGAGVVAGAVDASQLAYGTDRLRAALSARFRNHDDVQLVLEPLNVLTPLLVEELTRAAEGAPWLTLFFDTYERTAPFLDPWLLDLLTTDRYGALPANVVVTLAGQHGPDPARWTDYAGFVTEFALEPFSESEARQLLAAKGVLDETIIREVLRLSDCLPVLVSMLAESPGGDRDPASTAVELFLKWERDPGRKEAALACAFPRRLDEDVFRAAISPGAAEGSYDWLRGLPFVSERAGRVRYHDVVRTAMLRLQRSRSRLKWAERHGRLATAYGTWRAAVETDLDPTKFWQDESWRELRIEELYHLLCARPQLTLESALTDFVDACAADAVGAMGCALALADAGEAAESEPVRAWGAGLLTALEEEPSGVLAALTVLLNRATGLDVRVRARAHAVRGREFRWENDYERAVVEYGRALELDPGLVEGYRGRATTYVLLRDRTAALADLDRAAELAPDSVPVVGLRANLLSSLRRHEEALAAFDHVLVLDPVHKNALASRGRSRHAVGDDDNALADFRRALEIDPGYLWALVHRSEMYRDGGRLDESFADLDRAAAIAPASAWIASERGDAYRLVGRYGDAVRELGRACDLNPEHASAHGSLGHALAQLGRHEEARAAYDRAIELDPEYVWALIQRAELRGELGDEEGRFEDLDRMVALDEHGDRALLVRAAAYREAGRHEDYLADLDRALRNRPDSVRIHTLRGMAMLARGRQDEGLAHLDRVLSLNPDLADVYGRRANALAAFGRLPLALADLERWAELAPEKAPLVRVRTAHVLCMAGRYDEALALLDDRREAADEEDTNEVTLYRWWAAVATARWEQARQTAELMCARALKVGTTFLALTIGLTEGAQSAEPLWREARRITAEQDADDRNLFEQTLINCALGAWPEADALLAEALADNPDFEALAFPADVLTFLSRTPGIDPTPLTPLLTRLTEARDTFQARNAE